MKIQPPNSQPVRSRGSHAVTTTRQTYVKRLQKQAPVLGSGHPGQAHYRCILQKINADRNPQHDGFGRAERARAVSSTPQTSPRGPAGPRAPAAGDFPARFSAGRGRPGEAGGGERRCPSTGPGALLGVPRRGFGHRFQVRSPHGTRGPR